MFRTVDSDTFTFRVDLASSMPDEERRRLFLITSLRAMANEEKRIAEMSTQEVTDEIRLYGADRLRTLNTNFEG
jgi:hypothetical protein